MASVYPKFLASFFVTILFLQSVQAQGTCTCLGGRVSGSDIDDALRNCPVVNNCDPGFVCAALTCSALDPSLTRSDVEVECEIPTSEGEVISLPCVMARSSGSGDPHLIGFDGLRFDFHGVHGKNYVIFGRPSGDLLVSKIRATNHIKVVSGVNATFFDEFGLQVGRSGDHIRLYLARSSNKDGYWRPKVEVNGKEITESLSLVSCHIDFSPDVNNRVAITTKESNYVISTGRSESEHLHHLNLQVKLVRGPSVSEKYVGALGVTLNRALGHDVHPDLDVTGRPATLEMAMRSRFEAESLFPSRNRGDDMRLSGFVRMISGNNHVDKVWRAEGYSM